MFQGTKPKSTLALILSFAEVTFYATVRKVRKNHGNALLSIALSIFQNVLFIAAFYAMFAIMDMRGAAVRGNFVLYLMSGIFFYLTHIQALRGIMMTEGSTNPMMQHAPMNTLVSILSSALSALYIQTVSILCILLLLHTVIEPVQIHDWEGAFRMYLLVWGSGVVLGILFMAAKPWAPDVVQILSMVYIRANMIFSGKMFVANTLPAIVLPVFDWNPLFHIIDQARGYVFVNYVPHNTNGTFPFYFTIVMLVFSLMLEAYTRKHASSSWDAKR